MISSETLTSSRDNLVVCGEMRVFANVDIDLVAVRVRDTGVAFPSRDVLVDLTLDTLAVQFTRFLANCLFQWSVDGAIVADTIHSFVIRFVDILHRSTTYTARYRREKKMGN